MQVATIEEAQARKKNIFCCFIDFRKAFDIVPCQKPIKWLHALDYRRICNGQCMQYEAIIGRLRILITNTIWSTIEVK